MLQFQYILATYHFLRDIHERNLSLKNADKDEIQKAIELKDTSKGKMPVKKIYFLKLARLPLSAREKILNSFKSKIFPTKNY